MPSATFSAIRQVYSTTVSVLTGLRLTLRHLSKGSRKRKVTDIRKADYFEESTGAMTVEYPYESIPVPDHGRYRLHNEIEDCIVCDKCAKICPVDCIDIEPIKSDVEIRKTSDGSPVRLYAARFDIDMAKCCFCGLCTTVCPTECLTMTPSFDFSELDVRQMVYEYSDLDEAKIATLKAKEAEREALRQSARQVPTQAPTPGNEPAKPAFKPVFKPKPPGNSTF